MRLTRVKKFGSKMKYSVHYKFCLYFYVILLFITFSSDWTNGMLNDQTSSAVGFQAKWNEQEKPHNDWDKSSLSFGTSGGNCNEIFALVQNGKDSLSMQTSLKYEVYYIKQGNPKKGEVLFKGEIPGLKTGQKARLAYSQALKNGVYMFKTYQSPNHPGKGELWSQEINVNECQGKSNNNLKVETPKGNEDPTTDTKEISNESIENVTTKSDSSTNEISNSEKSNNEAEKSKISTP